MPAKVDLIINAKANVAELQAATASAQEFINTLKLGVGIDLGGKLVEGISEIGAEFRAAVSEGIKFNSQVQDAQLALAALAKNAQPEKFHSLGDAMAASAKGVDALRKAAVTSPFNFQTLLETLTGLSGPLYAGGVKDLQKQVDLTVLLSQAAKTLNLPQQLFQSDARDLVEGRVGRTLLGKGLGITDEDINKARQAGTEYEFLTQKLAAFGEGGAASMDNFSTRVSNLQDSLQQVEGIGTEGLFKQVSDLTKDLTTAINAPEFSDAAKTVGAELEVLFSGVKGIVEFVADNPGLFLGLAQGAVTFSVALGVLNLPKLVQGLIQIATNAVPAVANLATLGKATAAEGAAVEGATAKITAQTEALRANAAAAQQATEAQVRAASGPSTTPVEDAANAASTEQTAANTEVTEANNAATLEAAEATKAADAATAEANALTQESTTATEANTLATAQNTTEINRNNAAAVANNSETQASNALTQESSAVTEANTGATRENTEAIDQGNAAAVASNAETQRSNALTEASTVVTDADTGATLRSNAAAEASVVLGAQEAGISREEIALTEEGTAADDASLAVVTQANAAAAASVDIGKQEVKVIKDENAQVTASTDLTLANTAAVRDNAAAITAQEAAHEGAEEVNKATISTAQQATAAVEAHTAALKANAVAAEEAEAVGSSGGLTGAAIPASSTEGGSLIARASALTGPATISLLAIVQLAGQWAAYNQEIGDANDVLGKQLEADLATMRGEEQSVSNQADQAALISRLRQEQQKIEEAIAFAKTKSFFTDQNTIEALNQQRDAVDALLNKAEGLTQPELDLRRATDEATQALDDQNQSVGRLAEGFDKARLAYAQMFAEQQAKGAPTLGGRLQGGDRLIGLALETLQKQNKDPNIDLSTVDKVQRFVDPAAQDAKLGDYDAQISAATQTAGQKAEAAKTLADQLQALDAKIAQLKLHANELSDEPGYGSKQYLVDDALKQRETLQAQSTQANADSGTATDSLRQIVEAKTAYQGLQTAAMDTLKAIKGTTEEQAKTVAQAADSDVKVQQAALTASVAANDRAWKDKQESADQFYAKQIADIKAQDALERATIQAKPAAELPDDEKGKALSALDIKTQSALDAAADDHATKLREQTVDQLNAEGQKLALMQEEARTQGDIIAANQLGLQIQINQRTAEIQGNASLSPSDKASRISAVTAALTQQFNATEQQTNAEKALELAEKESADALTDLQTKRQALEAARLNPDAKADALRQLLLQENVVLNQQIAYLEQRRQLALQDITKSPNDRALTAIGIQGQISQTQRQVQANTDDANNQVPTTQFTNDLKEFINGFGTTANQAAKVVTGTLGTAVDSLASNLTKAIIGTETLKEAMVSFGQAAVQQFIELAIKMAEALALQVALDIATDGGAAAGGGLLGLIGLAEGGIVPGAPSHRDNRLAMVASGEFVARTAAVQHYGPGLFAALNSMAIPRASLASHNFAVRPRASLGFSDGGLVGPLPFAQGTTAAAQPSQTRMASR